MSRKEISIKDILDVADGRHIIIDRNSDGQGYVGTGLAIMLKLLVSGLQADMYYGIIQFNHRMNDIFMLPPSATKDEAHKHLTEMVVWIKANIRKPKDERTKPPFRMKVRKSKRVFQKF